MFDDDQISALVQAPAESLQVELKTWLDPRTNEGGAKLIKAIFAIRNRNGGFLLIGYNDTTLAPDPYVFAEPVREIYHLDVIQGLVSRYASQPFEIRVAFRDREGATHPVIVIPEGVRVPVVIKRDLKGEGGKCLLSEGGLLFRTLKSNGTPSSAHISPADYPELLEICFENREADIGRFLRRHLGGLESAAEAIFNLGPSAASKSIRDRAFEVIDMGSAASFAASQKRGAEDERAKIKNALTMRVGLVLEPTKPEEVPTQEFLNVVAASNPQYTGWPVWLDSRGFQQSEDRPYVSNGAWEALIVALDGFWSQHHEFLRFDPRGEFYLERVMQDDLTEKVQPGTSLDVVLMIYRVAEVLAVGTTMGRALGWAAESSAGFAFRWSGLSGRKLHAWVNALRWVGGGGGQSHGDSAESFVRVPLDTPQSALAPFVSSAVAPLFAAFNGYAPSPELVENSVRKLIERKLDS